MPETVDFNEDEAKTMLAANLYELGKLSLGQSAELAGYTKKTFIELLGKFNVSIFNQDVEELENDITNAANYHI